MQDYCGKSMLLSCQRLLDLLFALALLLCLFFCFSIPCFLHLQKLFNFIHCHVIYIGFEFQSSLHFSKIISIPFLRINLYSL